MNAKEVDAKFKGVLERAYEYSSKTGGPAPYPTFDPRAINVKNIEHDCRPKAHSIDFVESDNTIDIDWITQEDCSEHDKFDAELKRCFFNALKFDGVITVLLRDRDCRNEFEYVLQKS